MKYTGMRSTTKSKTMVKASFEVKNSGYWMHRLVMVASQKPFIGVQLNMPTRSWRFDQ